MSVAGGAHVPCLEDGVIVDLVEGRVALLPEWEAHLADCDDCRRVFAAAARGRTSQADPPAQGDEPGFDELGQGVIVGARYELSRFLGSGGMGVVWAATRLDGPVDAPEVAIKIARSIDPTMAHRFEREAKVVAALDHPNVVKTLEIVPATAARGPCLVQELLVGESLDARLRRGAMTLHEAASVVVPVAEAVAAAHARGILHRDLKPQNVFLTADRVVVLDFGIAKLLPSWGAHSRITGSGIVVGTPAYMSPEQLFGEAEPDERCDVWALGALLYCALAGRPPVQGATFGEVLRQLRSGPWVDLGERVPGLPPDVHALVRSALVPDRALRLQDVRPFIQTLRRWDPRAPLTG